MTLSSTHPGSPGSLLVLVLFLAGSAAGQGVPSGSQPTSTATVNPELAREFAVAAQSAMAKRQYDQAAASLRQALRYDPSLVEARYLLGKAYQAANQFHEAVGEYRNFLFALEFVDKPPADAAKWKADAETQLKTLCVHLRQWEALEVEFAKLFRNLSAGQGGLPSGARALEIAQMLSPGDNAIAGELEAARKLLPDVLPALADKPNTEGAKLLVGQAANLVKERKVDEAVNLLRNACGLSRDPELLTTVAVTYASMGKPAEAATVAAAVTKALEKADDKTRNALTTRVQTLVRKADPNDVKVDLLVSRLGAQAEQIAAAAMSAKDTETAREILSVLLRIQPGRDSAQRLQDKLAGAGPTIRTVPNLTSAWVKLTLNPDTTLVTRTARTIELKGTRPDDKAKPAGAGTLVLEPLYWGKSLRATWKIEELGPPVNKMKYGCFNLAFWPDSGTDLYFGHENTLDVNLYDWGSDTYRSIYLAKPDEIKAMLSEARAYEVTWEKEDAIFRLKVNGILKKEFELNAKKMAAVPSARVTLRLWNSAPPGHLYHVRATLLGFTCSPDCIKQK